MARPKKGAEKGRSAGIALRVTVEMKQAIDSLAKHNGRSISDEVLAALEAHLGWTHKGK